MNPGEWLYWLWPHHVDDLAVEAKRLQLEHAVTKMPADLASSIIFFSEADARQFQQVLPYDAGPLGREVVCREPWLIDDPEDALYDLDDADDVLRPPLRHSCFAEMDEVRGKFIPEDLAKHEDGVQLLARDHRSLMVLLNALPVDEQCQVADEVLHQADKILVDGNPMVDYRVRVTLSGRFLIQLSTTGLFEDQDE